MYNDETGAWEPKKGVLLIMMRVNRHLSNDRFPELINRTLMGERIIIEQEGKAAAAIITYVDLQRFEAVEALLKKAEQEEYDG